MCRRRTRRCSRRGRRSRHAPRPRLRRDRVARAFGRRLGVAPFTATTTRLVVDLNRSPRNRSLFSAYTRGFAASGAPPWSRSTTRRIATPSKCRPRRRRSPRTGLSRVLAQLHARTARRNPQLRRWFSLRPCAPRRGAVRRSLGFGSTEAAPDLVLRRNYPYPRRLRLARDDLRHVTPAAVTPAWSSSLTRNMSAAAAGARLSPCSLRRWLRGLERADLPRAGRAPHYAGRTNRNPRCPPIRPFATS